MRIQNTPFGSNPFKRSVAIITSAIFLSTSLWTNAPFAFAKPPNPSQVKGGNPSEHLFRLAREPEIRIPPELGKIDEPSVARDRETQLRGITKQPSPAKTIIFIQDAHDSLEAQENIAKIIHHLVADYGVRTVFEEGYEGPVPTDTYFGFIQDRTIREKVAYFLMDHLRIGGAEYAHINRTQEFRLIGADSIRLHLKNITQFQKAAGQKLLVRSDLAVLEKEIKGLADLHFPKELKTWMKRKELWEAERLPLNDYLKSGLSALDAWPHSLKNYSKLRLILGTENRVDPAVLEKVKNINAKELFAEMALMDQEIADHYLHGPRDRKTFEYYRMIQLWKRLNDLRLSFPEYQVVKDSLQRLDTEQMGRFIGLEASKTLILSRRWEKSLREAVGFYEIAQERDDVAAERMEGFLKDPDEHVAVLVFGGFHKNGLEEMLKARGVSCAIVSPKITQNSKRHQDYYNQLMTVGHHSFELPANLRTATRPESMIEIWDANPALARGELRVMEEVAVRMLNADTPSLALSMENALKTSGKPNLFHSQPFSRSEERIRPDIVVLKEKRSLEPEKTGRDLAERNGLLDDLWRVLTEEEKLGEAFLPSVRDILAKLHKFDYEVFPWWIDLPGKWPEYDPYEQAFVFDHNAFDSVFNQIIKYLRAHKLEMETETLYELFSNIKIHGGRGLLLLRIVPAGEKKRVEVIAMDRSSSLGPLTKAGLNISRKEQTERFMMKLGGSYQGMGTGLEKIQNSWQDFKAEIIPDKGTRISVAREVESRSEARSDDQERFAEPGREILTDRTVIPAGMFDGGPKMASARGQILDLGIGGPCTSLIVFDPVTGNYWGWHMEQIFKSYLEQAVASLTANGFDLRKASVLMVGHSPLSRADYYKGQAGSGGEQEHDDYEGYLERRRIQRDAALRFIYDRFGIDAKAPTGRFKSVMMNLDSLFGKNEESVAFHVIVDRDTGVVPVFQVSADRTQYHLLKAMRLKETPADLRESEQQQLAVRLLRTVMATYQAEKKLSLGEARAVIVRALAQFSGADWIPLLTQILDAALLETRYTEGQLLQLIQKAAHLANLFPDPRHSNPPNRAEMRNKPQGTSLPEVRSWAEATRLLAGQRSHVNLYEMFPFSVTDSCIFRGVYGEAGFNDLLKTGLIKTDKTKAFGGWWGDIVRAFFWATGQAKDGTQGILFEMNNRTWGSKYHSSALPGPVAIEDVERAWLVLLDSGSGPFESRSRMVQMRLPGMSTGHRLTGEVDGQKRADRSEVREEALGLPLSRAEGPAVLKWLSAHLLPEEHSRIRFLNDNLRRAYSSFEHVTDPPAEVSMDETHPLTRLRVAFSNPTSYLLITGLERKILDPLFELGALGADSVSRLDLQELMDFALESAVWIGRDANPDGKMILAVDWENPKFVKVEIENESRLPLPGVLLNQDRPFDQSSPVVTVLHEERNLVAGTLGFGVPHILFALQHLVKLSGAPSATAQWTQRLQANAVWKVTFTLKIPALGFQSQVDPSSFVGRHTESPMGLQFRGPSWVPLNRSEAREGNGEHGAVSFEAFTQGRGSMVPRQRRSTWIKPLNDFAVDRIFQRYQDEKEQISFAWFRGIFKGFFVETFSEKFFSLLKLKENIKALWRSLNEYGRDFVVFVVAYNILEDYLASPILLLLKMPLLATFVFFGHFEWIVYPTYLVVRQKLKKTFKKHLQPAEKERLRGFLKSKLSEAAGIKGRWKIVKKLLWIHPFLPKLMNETLLQSADPEDISSVTRMSIRELYFKCMGRILRDNGLKSVDAQRGLELILRGLEDPRDLWVRKVCAGAIGKFAGKLGFQDGVRAYDALMKRLGKERERVVREAIYRTLGSFPFEPALEILSAVVQDPASGFWSQKYAAESIGHILESLKLDQEVSLSPVVLKTVHALLTQIDPRRQTSVEVRVAAVDALARLRGDMHPELEDLRELINADLVTALREDRDPTVREHALWAIARHNVVEQDAANERTQAFEKILEQALDENFVNVAELSERYFRYLYQVRPAPFPKRLKTKIQKVLTRSRIAKPVIFIAVDGLFEAGRGRASMLASPQVEDFVKNLREANHLVLYARNFLLDRNRSAIQPDGSIAVFDDFDRVRFANVIERLRKGRPAHVPWIDFARGVVASSRTLIPNPKGCLVCIGSSKSLHKLAGAIDMQSRQIWHAEPDHLGEILDHLRKLSDKTAVMPFELTLVPVVDQTGRKILGEKPLVNAHLEGDRHLRSAVFVVTPEGKILRQKKTDQMTSEQNKFDISARAHVSKGETLASSAAQALSEKLGLNVPESELIRVGPENSLVRDQAHDREFVTVWVHFLRPGVLPKASAPDVGQLDEKYSFEELIANVQSHPDQYSRIMQDIANAPEVLRNIEAVLNGRGLGSQNRSEVRDESPSHGIKMIYTIGITPQFLKISPPRVEEGPFVRVIEVSSEGPKALIAFALKEGEKSQEKWIKRGDEIVPGLIVDSLDPRERKVAFEETRTWHETVDARTAEKLKRIDEVMAAIERDVFDRQKDTDKKKGRVFDRRKEHGGLLYAGTGPEGGVIAIRYLQRRAGTLMAPDKKFGDIGAGIGRMGAYAAVLSQVGEIVLIEPDPYLVERGKEALSILHREGVLDEGRIRWVQKTWVNAIDEVQKLDAAYIYSPLADDMTFAVQVDPALYGVRSFMKKTAYAFASNISGSGWGEIDPSSLESRSEVRGDLVARWMKAWERNLEKSRSSWGKDDRFSFPYNAQAPSASYDPETVPQGRVGPFKLLAFPDPPESDELAVTREQIASGITGSNLLRELPNILLADPYNSDLVVTANRWPKIKYHSLLISKSIKPQLMTGDYLESVIQWALQGAIIEFHRRKIFVDHFHAHLFSGENAPIADFSTAFKSTDEISSVKLGELTGYPAPHFAIASASPGRLKDAAMVIVQNLERDGVLYNYVVMENGKSGEVMVIFFIWTGVRMAFSFNTVGLVRTQDQNIKIQNILDGFQSGMVHGEQLRTLRDTSWSSWIKRNDDDPERGARGRSEMRADIAPASLLGKFEWSEKDGRIDLLGVLNGERKPLITANKFVYAGLDAVILMTAVLSLEAFDPKSPEGRRRREAVDWWSSFFERHTLESLEDKTEKIQRIGDNNDEMSFTLADPVSRRTLYKTFFNRWHQRDRAHLSYVIESAPFEHTDLSRYAIPKILLEEPAYKEVSVIYGSHQSVWDRLEATGKIRYLQKDRYYRYFAFLRPGLFYEEEPLPGRGTAAVVRDASGQVTVRFGTGEQARLVIDRNRVTYDVAAEDVRALRRIKIFTRDETGRGMFRKLRLWIQKEHYISYLREDFEALIRSSKENYELPDHLLDLCERFGLDPVEVLDPVLSQYFPYTAEEEKASIREIDAGVNPYSRSQQASNIKRQKLYYNQLFDKIFKRRYPVFGGIYGVSPDTLESIFAVNQVSQLKRIAKQMLNSKSEEMQAYLNAVIPTTTSFERKGHLFGFFSQVVLPDLVRMRGPGTTMRFLSVGCSYGAEPYGLAIMALEHKDLWKGSKIEIVATDVNRSALEKAKRGIFSAGDVEALPKDLLSKYFIHDAARNVYQVKPEVKEMVQFIESDILDAAERRHLGAFDYVMAMEVLSKYTGPEIEEARLSVMIEMLKPGGYVAGLNREPEHSFEGEFQSYQVYGPFEMKYANVGCMGGRAPHYRSDWVAQKLFPEAVRYEHYSGDEVDIPAKDKLLEAVISVYLRPEPEAEAALSARFQQAVAPFEPEQVATLSFRDLWNYARLTKEGKDPQIEQGTEGKLEVVLRSGTISDPLRREPVSPVHLKKVSLMRSEARRPEEDSGLDTVKIYVTDNFTVPIRLTDEEVRSYFGERVLSESQREGRTFFIRKLDPKGDAHFIEQWKKELKSDEEWLRARETKDESREFLLQIFPYFSFISRIALGVVSQDHGQERLEGFAGFEAETEGYDLQKRKWTTRLVIPQIEVHYKNVGHNGRIKGVADFLLDTLISMANNPDLRVTGGIRFNAMTDGSRAFAKRRGFESGGGEERILSQARVQREAERIAKVIPGNMGRRSEVRSDPRISGAAIHSKAGEVLELAQDVIVVVEAARIDALSPERFKELLKIAGLNRGPLHLVIPDALQGAYSSRVAELQRIATVHYGFPQLAASEKIPVIGFSDMEHDTLQAFQKRLGPKLAGRMKDSAFGLNQAGSFGVGILYALKDIPAEQLLPNQNGFRYDRNGWYASQILEILQSYTVSSISA